MVLEDQTYSRSPGLLNSQALSKLSMKGISGYVVELQAVKGGEETSKIQLPYQELIQNYGDVF